MSGEEKVTTSAQRPLREAKQSRPPVAERSDGGRRVTINWVMRTGALGAAITAVVNVLLFFQTRAWQMLVVVAGEVLAIACLALAARLVQRGKLDAAGYGVLFSMTLAFGIGELVHAGITLYLVAGGILMIFIVGNLVLPRKWGAWLALAGLFAAYIWLVAQFEPLPRYNIVPLVTLRIFVPGIITFLALAALWRLAHAYQRIGTIRTRLLIAFVLMVLLPAVAISASSAVLGWQSGRQQAINQLESVATHKHAEIETWVNSLRTDLVTALTGEEVTRRTIALLQMPDPSEYLGYWVRNHLQQVMEQSGGFEALSLINLQGQVILSTDAAQDGKTHGDQPFFREGLKGPYVQPPFYFTSPDQMSVVVARPVVDEQGYAWGILAGRVSLAALNEMMRERAGLGQTGEIYLLGADHALLTESRFGKEQVYVRTQGANTAIENQGNGSGLYDDYRGVPVVGVYHWLPELQMALLAEQDQSEAFGTIYTTLGVNVGVALASVLLAVVASLFITRSIAIPLANLAETATHIAAGDLERVAEVEREDEIGALAQAFNSMTAQLRDLIGSLEQRVADRTRGLQTAAEVARATTSVLDPDELLRQAVDLIRERFDLYYVGLFLLDEERRFAVLRAGTGEAGQKILAQGVRLEVGDTSMVGWCTAHAQPRVAPDVSQEPMYLEHPLLPDTRSEAVLPLIARGRVIGALDVTSMEVAAFDEADIAVMQTTADQVAVAIDNVWLLGEAQAALAEMEATHRRYLGQAWAEYVQTTKKTRYETERPGVAPLGDAVLPEIQQTMERRGATVLEPLPLPQPLPEAERGDQGRSHSALVAPIALRGKVIGALGIHDEDGGRQWTYDEMAIVEAIAERMALAAENLRLLEETQRRAARQRLFGGVTARMRETLDVETVLRTAVDEMYQALGLDEIVIRLAVGEKGGPRADG